MKKIILIILSAIVAVSSIFGCLYAFNNGFKSSVNAMFNVEDINVSQESIDNTDERIKELESQLNIANQNLSDLQEHVSNPNLIFNGRFRINQRGSSTVYRNQTDIVGMDRWQLSNGDGNFKRSSKTLTCTDIENPIIMTQHVEDAKDQLLGFNLTVSAEVDDVKYSKTFNLPTKATEDLIWNVYVSETGAFRVYYNYLFKKLGVQFIANPGCAIKVDRVKLEVGDIATKFLERSTGDELALCQRHYQVLNVDSIARGYAENEIRFAVPTAVTMRQVAMTFTVKEMPTIYAIDGTSFEPDSISISVRKDNIYLFKAICSQTIDVDKIYYITNGQICVDGEVWF